MRSLVIQGEVNKYGSIIGRLKSPNFLSRNDWEFRVSSLILTANENIDQEVYELGSSFNTSECFDYEKKMFMDKHTPICLMYVNCKKNKKQKFDLSTSSCPWLKIENVKDTVELSFFEPGTDKTVPKGTFSAVVHMWIKRK